MKKQCVIVSVLLFIVGATAMPQFSLQETSSGYTIELKVPALEIADVTVNALRSDGTPINETFASISIPGFHTGGDDFGCPQTILSGFQLAAEDANVSIEVRDVRQQTYSISKRIYPIQKPVPYCTTPAGETPQPFVIEEAAYRSTPKRSAAAFIREMYDFRGMKGIDVTISPMSYDPLQNSITVVTSMTLTITMKKPTRIDTWGSHVWSEAMRSIFKNLDGDLGRAIAGEPVSAEKYLIITNTTFKDNEDLAKFVQYRQKQGLSVEVVEKSAAGTTKENFTTFIRGKKPTYCILIGGPSDYPNYTVSFGGYTAKSYTPYVAATSSNPKPDIALGLWFTNNASGITNIVKKTIETEASCDKMPKKIMAIGGHSGSSMSDSESGKTLPANHCDVIAEEMYTQYFKNQGYSATLGFCTKEPKVTTAGCTKAMNDGLKFAWYNGHGSNTFWGPPNGQYWGNKDLGSFTNTVYPFMFTAACLTGTFTGSNGCMQEAFSTNVKGPVACIGAYEVSYMGQHSLTRALHREIMEVKKVTKYGVAYYTGLSGYAYDTAKASPKQINYSAGQYHFYGDPGVEMWTPPGATAIENGTLNDQHLSPVRMSVKVLPYRMVLTVNKPLREAATITIYSLRGSALQRVTVAAGDQSYSWDMRSSNGAALAKGTYVATLNSSGIEFKSIIKIGN